MLHQTFFVVAGIAAIGISHGNLNDLELYERRSVGSGEDVVDFCTSLDQPDCLNIAGCRWTQTVDGSCEVDVDFSNSSCSFSNPVNFGESPCQNGCSADPTSDQCCTAVINHCKTGSDPVCLRENIRAAMVILNCELPTLSSTSPSSPPTSLSSTELSSLPSTSEMSSSTTEELTSEQIVTENPTSEVRSTVVSTSTFSSSSSRGLATSGNDASVPSTTIRHEITTLHDNANIMEALESETSASGIENYMWVILAGIIGLLLVVLAAVVIIRKRRLTNARRSSLRPAVTNTAYISRIDPDTVYTNQSETSV